MNQLYALNKVNRIKTDYSNHDSKTQVYAMPVILCTVALPEV